MSSSTVGKENGHEPEWVEALLRVYVEQAGGSTPATFLERCRGAADTARTVRSLKESAGRIRFEPLPFSEYVERVAYAAGVSLETIQDLLSSSRAGERESPDEGSPAVVRLAVWMGIPLRELLVYLKLGSLVRAYQTLTQFVRLRVAEGSEEIPISVIEKEIHEIEEQIGPSFVQRRKTLESSVSRLYRQYAEHEV